MNENVEVITDAVTGEVTIREMSAADIAARAAARRAILLEDAKLPKAQFIIACKRAGILTQEEAVAAAIQNTMPAQFLAAIVAAGGDEVEAQITWAATSEVWRNDQYIQILAALPSVGESVADQLFGIV